MGNQWSTILMDFVEKPGSDLTEECLSGSDQNDLLGIVGNNEKNACMAFFVTLNAGLIRGNYLMFSRVPVGSNIFLEKVSFVTFCLILALF